MDHAALEHLPSALGKHFGQSKLFRKAKALQELHELVLGKLVVSKSEGVSHLDWEGDALEGGGVYVDWGFGLDLEDDLGIAVGRYHWRAVRLLIGPGKDAEDVVANWQHLRRLNRLSSAGQDGGKVNHFYLLSV